MVKCNRGQVRRLKRALRRTKTPVLRQRIQMVLLREAGMTQPAIAEAMGVSLRFGSIAASPPRSNAMCARFTVLSDTPIASAIAGCVIPASRSRTICALTKDRRLRPPQRSL